MPANRTDARGLETNYLRQKWSASGLDAPSPIFCYALISETDEYGGLDFMYLRRVRCRLVFEKKGL